MLTKFLALLLALTLPVAALSQATSGPAPLASAMHAMRTGDFARAADLAARAGRIGPDIIEWHRLRAGQGSYSDVIAFLARHPDWPGLPWLRRKSEPALADMTGEQRRVFFGAFPAQTPEGVLAYAAALSESGETDAAATELRRAFLGMRMSDETAAAFDAAHGAAIAPLVQQRLDHALWEGWTADARRLMPRVDAGWQALAEARIALREQKDGVNALIDAVPPALGSHPGLAYERFVWRARRGLDSAVDLLLERSQSAESLGRPEAWAGRRRGLARAEMRAGNHARAYRIAANHHLDSGSSFADLEWLSGYLALRFLDDPARALAHFDRFAGAVFTPISLGRAGYWRGRALDALGRKAEARAAYAEGGRHQTAFYGLLAAEAAGLPPDADLSGAATDGLTWRDAAFTRSSVHRAALLLLDAGELSLAERFWVHLAETGTEDEIARMGAMAIELGTPHLAVMLGKQAARQGWTITAPYYALHPLTEQALPVPDELALAIARRESEFDPVVVSGAGARGLMQLMPGTAELMARELGLEHDLDRLLTDPVYNARLGSAYLARLSEEFDGNVLLVSAGYNAGPGRPRQWIERFGDPRRRNVDAIDWIEHIPFNETRNYVMRVAESLPVYRARLGKPPHPVPFSRELTGSTLRGRD